MKIRRNVDEYGSLFIFRIFIMYEKILSDLVFVLSMH